MARSHWRVGGLRRHDLRPKPALFANALDAAAAAALQGGQAMSDLERLIEVMQESVRRNGSIPLTTGHLLNILKIAERKSEADDCGPDIGDEP